METPDGVVVALLVAVTGTVEIGIARSGAGAVEIGTAKSGAGAVEIGTAMSGAGAVEIGTATFGELDAVVVPPEDELPPEANDRAIPSLPEPLAEEAPPPLDAPAICPPPPTKPPPYGVAPRLSDNRSGPRLTELDLD